MKFDKYSKKYIHYYTGEVPSLIKDIFNRYSIRSMADLGSGDGALLFALLRKGLLDNITKVIAVDASEERLNIVRKVSDKISRINADVSRLKMLDNMSLDLVISNQVIEHIPDEDRFIKEVHRILSKDGLFYLSTVFKKWYGWYFYRCNGRWVLDPTHLREYTDANQLLNIIKRYKFKILEDKKTMYWFPLSDFVFKRIGLGRDVYKSKIMRGLRIIKIPILGYYNWELVLRKRIN